MITGNPFGVGASGERRERVEGRYGCCGLGYIYERWPGGDTGPHCTHCQGHAQGSGATQEQAQLARLLAHEPRMRKYADQALKRAKSYGLEAKQAKADAARQAASALRQRDLYRTLLTEVYKVHTDRGGHCKACGSKYPCGTIKVLEGASGGAGDAIVRAAARRDNNVDFDPE
jgi:hypothetical protein